MILKETLRKELLKRCRTRNGRVTLTCRQAHAVAEKLDMPLARIGRLCDEEKVKLVACKLGCF